MILTLEDCQLEFDTIRGVLYVYNKETGITVLRIGGLEENKIKNLSKGTIEITIMDYLTAVVTYQYEMSFLEDGEQNDKT